MTTPQLVGDVIVQRAGPDRWLLYNVRARTAIGLDTDGLRAVDALLAGSSPATDIVDVWRPERFTNVDGLLADPTRLARPPSTWPPADRLSAADLLDRLEEAGMVATDAAAYDQTFGLMHSLMDRSHRGNFHQQLGRHLLLEERTDPATWWLDQKFEPDRRQLRTNLYAAVQQPLIDRWIHRCVSRGTTILDIGCGTGFYAARMAAAGADVTGVDPNPGYLAIAADATGDRGTFHVADIGSPGALDFLDAASFDIVFMSDALLFYFTSPSADPPPDIDVLLADVRRLLRSGGRFVSVEPHYLWWLAPWLGDEDAPFTVITEYGRRRFGVTATIAELVQAFSRNGLAITWMEEAYPDPAFESVDRRAYRFAAEFPLWQLYEASVVDRTPPSANRHA